MTPTWSGEVRGGPLGDDGRAETWGPPGVARKGRREGAPGRGNSMCKGPGAGAGVDEEGGTGGAKMDRPEFGPREGFLLPRSEGSRVGPQQKEQRTRCYSLKGHSAYPGSAERAREHVWKSPDQSGGRAGTRRDTMRCFLGVEAVEVGRADGLQAAQGLLDKTQTGW